MPYYYYDFSYCILCKDSILDELSKGIDISCTHDTCRFLDYNSHNLATKQSEVTVARLKGNSIKFTNDSRRMMIKVMHTKLNRDI